MAETVRREEYAIRIMKSNVLKLSGFLSGIAALDGGIRDCSAFSFAVSSKENDSVEDAIRSHFSWLAGLSFSEVQVLEGGLRDLEMDLRNYLLRSSCCRSAEKVFELRRYLSFRIMEEIADSIGDEKVVEVARLTATSYAGESESVFFSVHIGDGLIVLQFNNDIPFKRRVEAPTF